MHQNQFRLGPPRAPLEELTAFPQTSWLHYGGITSDEREMGVIRDGQEREMWGRKNEEIRKKGRKGTG